MYDLLFLPSPLENRVYWQPVIFKKTANTFFSSVNVKWTVPRIISPLKTTFDGLFSNSISHVVAISVFFSFVPITKSLQIRSLTQKMLTKLLFAFCILLFSQKLQMKYDFGENSHLICGILARYYENAARNWSIFLLQQALLSVNRVPQTFNEPFRAPSVIQ